MAIAARTDFTAGEVRRLAKRAVWFQDEMRVGQKNKVDLPLGPEGLVPPRWA